MKKETLSNHSTSIGSRLFACEVALFKTRPYPLLRSHLPSLPMDVYALNIIVCAEV